MKIQWNRRYWESTSSLCSKFTSSEVNLVLCLFCTFGFQIWTFYLSFRLQISLDILKLLLYKTWWRDERKCCSCSLNVTHDEYKEHFPFFFIMLWPWQTCRWHKHPMLIIYNPTTNDKHDSRSNGISLSLGNIQQRRDGREEIETRFITQE